MESLVIFLSGPGGFPVWFLAFVTVVIAAVRVSRGELAAFRGRIIICFSLLFLSFAFFLLSFGIEEIEAVDSSARMAPRLWAAGLAFFTLLQLHWIMMGRSPEDPEVGDIKKVILTFAIVAFSLWGMNITGYLISSGCMILLLLLLFGERRLTVLISLAGGWVLFSWFVFMRLLMLSLPAGILFG